MVVATDYSCWGHTGSLPSCLLRNWEGGRGQRERFQHLQLSRAACCEVVISVFLVSSPKYRYLQQNMSSSVSFLPKAQGFLLQTKLSMNERSGNTEGAFKWVWRDHPLTGLSGELSAPTALYHALHEELSSSLLQSLHLEVLRQRRCQVGFWKQWWVEVSSTGSFKYTSKQHHRSELMPPPGQGSGTKQSGSAACLPGVTLGEAVSHTFHVEWGA